MGALKVVDATKTQAESLSQSLRAADLREIKAFSNLSPIQELQRPLLNKQAHTYSVVDAEGFVYAMFGVSRTCLYPLKVGAPWMLASDNIFKEHKREFLKQSPTWIDFLGKEYDVLENFVYARNEIHIRWLKHVGFEFVQYMEKWGAQKEPFWRFRMVMKKGMVKGQLRHL